MGFDRATLTKKERLAIDIIRSGRGLGSMQSDYSYVGDKKVYDNAEIDSLFDQLSNPTKYRPKFVEELFTSNGMIMPPVIFKTDLRSGEVKEIIPGECRNTEHKGVVFQHTAKTATSLLPPEPEYMQTIGMDLIGFLWDIDDCNLHDEKYVWATDGGSGLGFWISPNPTNATVEEDAPPISSVTELRAKNNKAVAEKKTIEWNEILAGLPIERPNEGKIRAMFAPLDRLEVRLRVLKAMWRAKEKFKHEEDIPIFIIQADRGDGGATFRVYTAAEREADLKIVMAKSERNPLVAAIETVFNFVTRIVDAVYAGVSRLAAIGMRFLTTVFSGAANPRTTDVKMKSLKHQKSKFPKSSSYAKIRSRTGVAERKPLLPTSSEEAHKTVTLSDVAISQDHETSKEHDSQEPCYTQSPFF